MATTTATAEAEALRDGAIAQLRLAGEYRRNLQPGKAREHEAAADALARRRESVVGAIVRRRRVRDDHVADRDTLDT